MRNKELESKAKRLNRINISSFLISHFLFLIFISSCSLQKQISRSATHVINDPALKDAHIGIDIYEPSTGRTWYDYQGCKYFVPASNTKIPTCYAAMKYLGDSLVGLKYGIPEREGSKNVIVIQPTGDPTFLHPDYKQQPVYDFLKKSIVDENKEPALMDTTWKENRWGSGWGWSDYQEAYMAERNSFPIFGNTITISLEDVDKRNAEIALIGIKSLRLFKTGNSFFDSLVNESRLIQSLSRTQFQKPDQYWSLSRDISGNYFEPERSKVPFRDQTMPFATDGTRTTISLLENDFKKQFGYVDYSKEKDIYTYECPQCDFISFHIRNWNIIHSQPVDSLLKPMMHRSDNFFAEQSLLMVSNQVLGVMNDEMIIDTLLKTDFKDIPQKPHWVDGCGLSRYDLFSPKDFVFILNKMKQDFGMDRIKVILPTGGQGTLSNYYLADKGYIYAKTGSLSGVLCLSGFLYTKKGKLLIFSVLVNNHRSSPTAVRRAIEKFLQGIRDRY